MASSSSSPSSSSCNWPYDIFPSFSGEDVRKTFLSHFLKELDQKLIIAFKDNEIERGQSLDPELKQAIRGSRIAVVVFSENYASSSWCLNELLEIVKCKKDLNQVVIPIFYRLDPSHVRKQNGDFGEIFEKTCQNKSDDEKIQWRRALTDVANILGYHIVTWANEANMIEEIVNDVLGKLNLSASANFDEFVGIEDHIKKMSTLLYLESEEVRMVGIWGPSGIGKTIIARALFTRLSRLFQSSVFIDKVFISRSTKERAGLVDYNTKLDLQRNFLALLLDKKDIKIDHIGGIEKMLKHRKTLIVIDDLDDQDVLDAIAGQTQWFGSGSRIIVVTKNKHLLRANRIDKFYEVCLPSYDLALEMFCRSAFRQNSPPDGFSELASEVISLAGNLPLGLEVLGSSLRGRDREDWMDMMPRLRNGLDGKIEKTLRVSYEELNNKKDEAIFRHIACLFNGESVNDIKQLLADSNLDVNIGLKNLVDKSLIKESYHIVLDMQSLLQELGKEIVRAQSDEPGGDWDVNALFQNVVEKFVHERDHKTVEMHSLVQELGKNIVREQSDEAGNREFLVDLTDICDVLEDDTGTTKKVLGIALNVDETNEVDIHEDAFKAMRNLLFLKMSTKKEWNLPEGVNYFPPKLRLLSWDNYPMRFLPTNFRPKNLVKIQMRESKLEKLWDGVQYLNIAEFSECGALAECSWSHDDSSSEVTMSTDDIQPKFIDDPSCPPKGYFSMLNLSFVDCFNFDANALISQQSAFMTLILLGEEVPLYFTHRATGASLSSIPLPNISTSQPVFSFRCCVVVDATGPDSFEVGICLGFMDRLGNLLEYFDMIQCFSADVQKSGSYLAIFDYYCPLTVEITPLVDQLKNGHMDIQFCLTRDDSKLQIKRCGIQFPDRERSSNHANFGGP
ncbi:unnamed protein product [Thlaspi arvense]|uniref:ADP-ribosyl cyclase/cyclic ADP-ribose hydrolase n=1 Tax=Thlaspi arvense TaxID=13288 RepID=A0AAU9SA81_THLAR|nr:unnamed protein product [Thlaspi arvense]